MQLAYRMPRANVSVSVSLARMITHLLTFAMDIESPILALEHSSDLRSSVGQTKCKWLKAESRKPLTSLLRICKIKNAKETNQLPGTGQAIKWRCLCAQQCVYVLHSKARAINQSKSVSGRKVLCHFSLYIISCRSHKLYSSQLMPYAIVR